MRHRPLGGEARHARGLFNTSSAAAWPSSHSSRGQLINSANSGGEMHIAATVITRNIGHKAQVCQCMCRGCRTSRCPDRQLPAPLPPPRYGKGFNQPTGPPTSSPAGSLLRDSLAPLWRPGGKAALLRAFRLAESTGCCFTPFVDHPQAIGSNSVNGAPAVDGKGGYGIQVCACAGVGWSLASRARPGLCFTALPLSITPHIAGRLRHQSCSRWVCCHRSVRKSLPLPDFCG